MWRRLIAFLGVAVLALPCCTDDLTPPSITADRGPADMVLESGTDMGPDLGLQRPSALCASYLACVEAAEPGKLAAEKALYDKDSECWDSPQKAQPCDQACKTGYEALEKVHITIAACGGCNPAEDSSCSIVGTPCTKDEECETGRCLQYLDYVQAVPKDGYCTKFCEIGKAEACPDGSFCGGMPTRAGIFDPRTHPAYCYRICDPKKPDACRPGYECSALLLDLQGTTGPMACLPIKKK